MGAALEFYVKDAFSGTLSGKRLSEKEKIYPQFFSYLGNQNNPPDAIIREGDAIEVKKYIGRRSNGIALNSSYPKDYLYADSPMITASCRECEEWTRKDMLYAIGGIEDNRVKSLWFVYGDCYAASRDTYEKIRDSIAGGIDALPDIEFGETNELGRVNRVDPLGITDLRIRGMWSIQHPSRVFRHIPEVSSEADFALTAVMLKEKYESFPKESRKTLENSKIPGLRIEDIEIQSPNNAAKSLRAKLVRYTR